MTEKILIENISQDILSILNVENLFLKKKKKLMENYDEHRRKVTDIVGELMEFSRIYRDESGLPMEIYVDDGGSYKRSGHPLWLYFRINGRVDAPKSDEFLPMSVSDNPEILTKKRGRRVELTNEDITKLKNFVKVNRRIITALANNEIQNTDFHGKYKPSTASLYESRGLLVEMSSINPKDSGLKVPIWVDEGTDKQHGERIKFKSSKDQNSTHEYTTMTIDSNPKVIGTLPSKNSIVNNKDIEDIRQFVIANKTLLLRLASGEIRLRGDFLTQMYRFENGKLVPPKEVECEVVGEEQYGVVKVKSKSGKFNFRRLKDGKYLSTKWYDSVDDFKMRDGGGVYARVFDGALTSHLSVKGQPGTLNLSHQFNQGKITMNEMAKLIAEVIFYHAGDYITVKD